MIELDAKIFQSGTHWMLEVTAGPAQQSNKYIFRKDGFPTYTDAKQFLMKNIGLFVFEMGQP